MALYRLFYRVTTPLSRQDDLVFGPDDPNPVTIRFAQKRDGEASLLAELNVEANGYRQAQTVGATLVPRVLDCLAYASGAPLLLGICELVLRAEIGSDVRRGVFTKERRMPADVRLGQDSVDFAQAIFDSDGPKLPLCWLRFSNQRELTLERFVFSCLGFEELAGDTDIETICPACGTATTHRGADKERAWELFRSANPNVYRRTFEREIWGRARNALFHGSQYPTPEFLRELQNLAPQLQSAVSAAVRAESNVEGVPHAVVDRNIFHYETYFSWRTRERDDAFPNDWPKVELERLLAEANADQWQILREENLELHNARDFADW